MMLQRLQRTVSDSNNQYQCRLLCGVRERATLHKVSAGTSKCLVFSPVVDVFVIVVVLFSGFKHTEWQHRHAAHAS